jgi:hypothetical protein
MRILKEEDWETAAYDSTITALEKMGAPAVERVLEFGQQTSQRITVAAILSEAGKRDPRAFEFIRQVFERQKQDHEYTYMAENLLACDAEAGRAYLESWMKTHRLSKKTREQMNKLIADARAGRF